MEQKKLRGHRERMKTSWYLFILVFFTKLSREPHPPCSLCILQPLGRWTLFKTRDTANMDNLSLYFEHLRFWKKVSFYQKTWERNIIEQEAARPEVCHQTQPKQDQSQLFGVVFIHTYISSYFDLIYHLSTPVLCWSPFSPRQLFLFISLCCFPLLYLASHFS